MSRFLLALSLVLLVALPSFASDGGFSPEMFNIQEHVLDNGLQVLMVEDHSAPLIHYQVYFRVGSRHEQIGSTGLAHFFEHMMFRGSTKYGPEEHNDIVKAHGGQLNANTYYDRTTYFENISSDQLELIIHLEAERQANLNIVPETFNPERQVVAEERRTRVDNDLFGSAFEQLITNMYRTHQYSWPVIGWMSDIQSWTQEDLVKFYKTYYAPNNATIILVGDFDPENAISLIEKYYGKIPAQPAPRPTHSVEPAQVGERRVYYHRPAQLPFVLAGFHIPGSSHEDITALNVAQKILSDGQSSRIYKTCVYEKQISPFAGGQMIELRDPGMFVTYIGVMPGADIQVAEDALFEVIETLGEEGPTERELQKAKNQIEADFIFGMQSNQGKATNIGENMIANDGDYMAFLKFPEKVQSVTAEDVKRVVKKYLNELNRTTLILVPDNEAQAKAVDFSEGK